MLLCRVFAHSLVGLAGLGCRYRPRFGGADGRGGAQVGEAPRFRRRRMSSGTAGELLCVAAVGRGSQQHFVAHFHQSRQKMVAKTPETSNSLQHLQQVDFGSCRKELK